MSDYPTEDGMGPDSDCMKACSNVEELAQAKQHLAELKATMAPDMEDRVPNMTEDEKAELNSLIHDLEANIADLQEKIKREQEGVSTSETEMQGPSVEVDIEFGDKRFTWDKLADYEVPQASYNNPLGEGTYGVVYKGTHTESRHMVALKKIKADSKDGLQATTIREISILMSLDHKNIVKVVSPIYHDNFIYIVFPLFNWDMSKYLKQKGPLKVPAIHHLFKQVLEGLSYCHNNRIYHRDLKPQNLLISRDGKKLVIADLGLARVFSIPRTAQERELTSEVVTLYYRCPEIMLGDKEYGGGVDTWAAGCILMELLTGQPCFRAVCDIMLLFNIFEMRGTPTEENWPGVTKLKYYSPAWPVWEKVPLTIETRNPKSINVGDPLANLGMDLVDHMLTMDPCSRIAIDEAIHHPFTSMINYQKPKPEPRRRLPIPQMPEELKQAQDLEGRRSHARAGRSSLYAPNILAQSTPTMEWRSRDRRANLSWMNDDNPEDEMESNDKWLPKGGGFQEYADSTSMGFENVFRNSMSEGRVLHFC